MLGLPEGQLWVVDHDPAWPAVFARESEQIIASAPAGNSLRVEHVGSTSVPGLCAKPIIDIAITIARFEEGRALVGPFASLGYVHRRRRSSVWPGLLIRFRGGTWWRDIARMPLRG